LNVIESITKATPFLEKHGVPSPRLNAEVLLGYLLGISRLEIYTGFDRPLSDDEAGALRLLLIRRASGYPLQYMTREVGFRTAVLEVRPGVFIPRPETEVLVEKALELLPDSAVEVLDVGTGCGNIAICVALERRDARVTAIDNDWLSVELCGRNAARNGVEGTVSVLEGDLFEPLETGREFDAILSNPPYIPMDKWESLPLEVRGFEPMEALVAGGDGLDVIRRIIGVAPGYLKEGGWLLLEVDETQAERVVGDLLSSSPLQTSPLRGEDEGGGAWTNAEYFRDLAGRPRVVRARLAGAVGS